MGIITSVLSGIVGGVGYALAGWLANAQKESFNLPKFITTIFTGAISGLGSSVIGVNADPVVLAAASAGVTASAQKFIKAMLPIEITSNAPENALDAKIKAKEGSATKTISHWDGSPLQTLYIVATGKTYIATRKAENSDEAEVARQSNIARQFADGFMTEDQVRDAGYDPNKLLPQFRLIWDDQAEELKRLTSK